MGDMPKVSVIVPVYNVEQYLPKCLDSLIKQTLDDIEILIIDDGSTDSSGVIADQYAESNKNIVVVHKPNEGYGKTMNLGLSLVKGEYVGILESDDWCSPFMLERLYTVAKEKDIQVIKSDYYQWWGIDDHSRYQNVVRSDLYDVITNIKRNAEILFLPPTIWSALYKRDFLEENCISFLGTPGASYQDTSFHHKVMCCVKSLLIINEGYIYYRQDNTSSSVNNKGKIFCICDEYNESYNFLKNRDATLIRFLERARVGGYIWNYNRLNEEGRRLFYPRMREDFARIKKEGHLKNELYGQKAIVQILSIINMLGKYSKQKMENSDFFSEQIKLS